MEENSNVFRISSGIEAFRSFVKELFLAYDDMNAGERARLVGFLSDLKIMDAIELVVDKSSLRKAFLDNPVNRKVVVDEDTGLAFETVEGNLDEEAQDRIRGIEMEDSNS